jgi:hypothetical protein
MQMANKHNMSFFGQTTGIILQSAAKTEPWIFFRCIKKKPKGTWEKPSKGEGKVIKCSLEEIIMILSVLNKKMESWSAYHSFKDMNTQIQFKWDENDGETLWVHIGNYSKMLKYSQIELLRLLLTHILNEKIEFATSTKETQNENYKEKNSYDEQKELLKGQKREDYKNLKKRDLIKIIETVEPSQSSPHKRKDPNSKKTQFNKIVASIKRETPKALLLEVENGIEVWIPKSGIKKDYSEEKGISQSFNIENWILEKKDIQN